MPDTRRYYILMLYRPRTRYANVVWSRRDAASFVARESRANPKLGERRPSRADGIGAQQRNADVTTRRRIQFVISFLLVILPPPTRHQSSSLMGHLFFFFVIPTAGHAAHITMMNRPPVCYRIAADQ